MCYRGPKELGFFSCDDRYVRGIAEYERIISVQLRSRHSHVCDDSQAHAAMLKSVLQVIDGTPETMAEPVALRRIKLAYGSHPLKIIVLLRDPVDR